MTIAEVKAILGNRTFLDERQTRGARGRDLWIIVYSYPDGTLSIGFENGAVRHTRVNAPVPTMKEALELAESRKP